MQYRVPQNIDQEDKILGPLTFVQFIYVLIGGATLLVLFAAVGPNFLLFFLLGLPILLLTVAFALIKVQGQPFTRFFVSLLVYLKQPKQRLWRDTDNGPDSSGLGLNYARDLISDTRQIVQPASPSVTQPVENPAPANSTTGQTIAQSNIVPVETLAAPATAATAVTATPAKPQRRLAVQVERSTDNLPLNQSADQLSTTESNANFNQPVSQSVNDSLSKGAHA